MKKKVVFRFTHILIPLALFIGTYLIYKSIYPDPRNWYDHYLHLARSLVQLQVDVPDLPKYYQDKINIDNKTYLPFPPGASFVLLPFVLFMRSVTQQQISILIGAINVALLYLLFKKFTKKISAVFLSLFVGFGTSFFWASIVGTTWFFAHIVSIFYLVLSLLLIPKNKNRALANVRAFTSGLFFALASLTRFPVLASGLFFVYVLKNHKKLLMFFLLGAFFFIPTVFLYNYLRFGNVWQSGYTMVYQSYVDGNLPYSIQRIWFPGSEHLAYFDIASIPYHLYTFFLMPPQNFKPSPYGMGILFTSPFLFLAFFPPFKKRFETASLLAIVPTSILIFTHYAHGWVQFGYRFVLDFLVYLMIILAIRFKPNKTNVVLLLISVVVNFWGVKWAIKLGW